MIWNMRRPAGVVRSRFVAQAGEGDAQRLELRQRVDQVLEAAGEAVQLPNQDGVAAPLLRVRHQLIEMRA
jgi:hypothetical protein